MARRASLGLLSITLLAAASSAEAQQNLGHKTPGTVGLDAGAQAPPGFYLAYQFVHFDAVTLRDRDGDEIPVPGFDADARVNAFGVGATLRLALQLHLSATFAVPFAHVSLAVDEPLARVDRFGLGDIYCKPLQLGWRSARFDLVASYGFYAPTNQISERGVLGAPQWAHQLSAGGALYFDDARRWSLSALGSYDLHHQKQGIDITRGDSVQIQGGIGGDLFGVVELGLAGYALWQVTDDSGDDLPPILRGNRDRVYGLGPELNLMVPELRAKLGFRYMHDFGVEGRPEGQLVVVALSTQLWAPDAPR
jgi:hypothetical protein